MTSLNRIAAILVVVLLSACAHNHPVVATQLDQKLLGHIKDGVTTKEDILLRYGSPSAVFGDEQIFTYRMILADDTLLCVISRELDASDPRISQWSKGEYSLVLSFDERSILRKHSLVSVR